MAASTLPAMRVASAEAKAMCMHCGRLGAAPCCAQKAAAGAARAHGERCACDRPRDEGQNPC
eukprot:361663-Chlamydomonas_euryale.AAC.5